MGRNRYCIPELAETKCLDSFKAELTPSLQDESNYPRVLPFMEPKATAS